jgi:hypothetical protein
MRLPFLLLALALAIPVSAKKTPEAAVPPPVPARVLTPDDAAKDFIYHLLMGHRDSVAALFEEGMREKVTPEVLEDLQSQFKWLYNFIGGEFELFMSGFGHGDSSFFREYRMSNESNKRYPLILVQVVFPDSSSPVLIGAQVKSFLAGQEKPLGGEQIWKVGDRNYDLHAIVVAETQRGNILAVQFYDEDTAALSHESVARNGIPLAREAVARGYPDSARKVLDGKPLMEDIGVVFIRKDRREGMLHAKVGFSPADLGLPSKAAADSAAAAKAAEKKKPKPKPAATKK